MVISLAICGVFILGVGYWFGLRTLFRRPTEQERAASTLRHALDQVEDVFHETRIRMEEAVGRRRPGERRIGDGLRGSWRDW